MPIINMVYKKKEQWWKPWANTIAYYPLNSTSTVNDMSGNNHTLTNVGSVTFDSIAATFSWSNYLYCSPLWETNPFTVSFWLYIDSSSRDSTEKWLVRHTWGTYYWWHSTLINHSTMPHTKDIRVGTEPSNNVTYSSSTPSDWWHNVVLVCSTSNMSFYLDNVLQGTNTAAAQTWNNWYFTIWIEYWNWFNNCFYKWKMSEVIVESWLRDETARTNYYNQTKANYWIS